jgi:hypothetical protein
MTGMGYSLVNVDEIAPGGPGGAPRGSYEPRGPF